MSDDAMYGAVLGLAKRTKTAEKHADGWMNRALNAEKRLRQREIELKVEICSHAGTVAQNEALRGVLDGKWTRDYLGEEVGTGQQGDPRYRFGRIFREAFLKKAK